METKRIKVRIHRSLTGIIAQAIDSDGAIVVGRYFKFDGDTKPVEQSITFGEQFAGELKKAKRISIVFDRSKSRYHGRVKAFAEGMRKNGIEF